MGYLPPMSQSPEQNDAATRPLDGLERQVVDVFVDGVKVLGLPRSIGEIYGMLFISPVPLALDDLVERLDISKGSASQGLRALKDLGAIREVELNGGRRTYFEPAVELKRLVGGFIREQVRPHLDSGKQKLGKLSEAASKETDPERRKFLEERLERLENWMKRGGMVLPLIQKILGQ